MGNNRLTDKRIKDALERYYGNLVRTADHLGCTRQTLYNRMKKKPELEDFRRACEDIAVDKAEAGLHEALEEKDPWAIKFTLGTKGKKRGYTRKVEVDHGGQLDMTIRGVDFSPPALPPVDAEDQVDDIAYWEDDIDPDEATP